MNPDQIIELLERLAEKLTPPAQYVFDLAVRQIMIDGAIQLLVAAMSVVVVVVIFVARSKAMAAISEEANTYNVAVKEGQHYSSYDLKFVPDAESKLLSFAIAAALAAFPAVFGVSSLLTGLQYLLNPEWWVLMRLAQLLP
jgi:hypothetical protein